MNRKLTLAEMKLEKAVVELRHPRAFLLWDRAGTLWRHIQKALPGVEPLDAQPSVIRFRLPPNDDLTTETDVHRIISTSPDRKLADLKRRVDHFSRAVMDTLEITQLTRVGLRLIYSTPTQSRDEATRLVLAKGLIRLPDSLEARPPFSGRVALPEVAFRWEGKAIGIAYRLRADLRNFELNIPPDFPEDLNLKSLKREIHHATLDLDYYTTVSMSREQLILGEWLESGLKILRREADRLLEASRSE